MKTFILKRDYFGHHIRLLFNDRGSSHNTIIGGLTSIIINIFMIGYVSILLKRFILFENDRVTTLNKSQDFGALGPVNFTETNSAFLLLLMDSQTGEQLRLEEISEYITIQLEQQDWKLQGNVFVERNYSYVPFRKCGFQDIKNVKDGLELYHNGGFSFYPFLCPAFDENH